MIGGGIRVFAVSSVRAAANCCEWMKGRRFVLRAKTPGHDLGRGHYCGRLDMWRRVLRFPQAVVRQLVRVIHASVHALCVAADGCETGACMFVSVARHDRRRIAAELLFCFAWCGIVCRRDARLIFALAFFAFCTHRSARGGRYVA
eukprot:7132932-Prymnesium_polylepis.1